MELDTGVENKKIGIVVLFVLLLLVLPGFSNAQTSSQNYKFSNLSSQYYTSESIVVDITNDGNNATNEDLSSVLELWLVKNRETKKYLGELKFPLSISLDAEGTYELVLVNSQNEAALDSKTINIVNGIQIISDQPYPDEFGENISRMVNEIVNSLTNPNNASAINSSSDDLFSNDSQINPFYETPGNLNDCSKAVLEIDKTEIYLGEEIHANIGNYDYVRAEDRFEFKIAHGDSTYRFMGYSQEARFTPTETGTYVASIECNGQIVQTKEFNVTQEIPLISEVSEKQIKIRDSKGKTSKLSVKVWSSSGEMQRKGLFKSLMGVDEIINSTIEVNLSTLNGLDEGKIKFNEFRTDNMNNVELKVESLNSQEQVVNGNIPVYSYAMDLSNLNFTNGTFTSMAKGNELWKCKEWDYEAQSCNGSWIKVKDITPGKEYSLEISPEDPGYAETGVATINTRKSYYMPGEEVEIFAVVLDREGYLVSNASVQIKVTTPENDEMIMSTRDGQVVEGPKGIYSVIFFNTAVEGNYTIFVSAKGQNVEYNMSSMFAVQHDYDFEVIRNTPLVTDPFKETLYSSITIIPRIPVDSYNFTEILPIELEVLSAPGATITFDENNSKTYLKWTDLSGTFVAEYTAQPPLKTPNILRLGRAFVEYYFNGAVRIFEELREWILAIDPEVPTDDGLVVYGDQTNVGVLKYRNWTSDVLQAEQSGPSTGTNNIVWIKLRCQKNLPICVLGATNWDGSLFFSTFSTDTWTWSNSATLCTDTFNEYWSWDLDCEANSNKCIIAYENRSGTGGTGNNANFMYRIWNGTSLTTTDTIGTVTGGENRRFEWIKLYPKKNSNVMGIAIQNDMGGNGGTPAIYGGIWNGSSFGTWQEFTTNGPSTSNNRTNYRHFDCGWEGGFGRLICAYGEDGVNSIFAYRYNGTTGWDSLGRIYNGTAEVLQVAVCGQEPSSNFTHSYVGIMDCDTASDLDGGIWNGVTFSKSVATDAPAKNTNSECGANQGTNEFSQNFQCTWVNSGNKSVFVWVRNSADTFLTSGTYTISTGLFSMASWASGVKITASGTNQLRSSTLVSNPYNDKVFLVYSDANRNGGCSLWRGNTWDGSGCNNAAAFETNGGQAARTWLGFDWFRLRLEPYITIIKPALVFSEYTYFGLSPGGTQMAAFNGNTSLLPPTAALSPVNGTEFTAGNYYDSSVLDDSYASSVFSAALTGQRAYQSYRFYVSDPSISMSQIKLIHEGYATRTTSLTPDDFNIYFYNWNTGNYTLFRTVYGGTGGDIYSETLLSNSFTNYVQNNYFYVLIEAYTATGAGAASRRSEISTDYIALDVESRPVLSGTQLYNATAVDKDGVSGCRWQYYNTSFSNMSGKTEMSLAGVYYYNITNTLSVADGNYYIYVFCNDTLGNTRNSSIQVRIDNTPPAIALVSPGNTSNITFNYALFSWNATDIPYENMKCNLTVDEVIKDTNRVSPHGQLISKNVTALADGNHSWYVRCGDDAGNSNVSETRVFDTDTTAPVVTPNFPPSAGALNYLPFDINFTVTDSHPIPNCSVYIDGALNTTFYNVTKSVPINLTIYNMTEGLHRWNVSCYDSFGYKGNSSLRNFTLDFGLPWIILSTPDPTTFNGTPAQFNYTAYDILDSSLMCNITANDEVIDANIPSDNGTKKVRNVSLIDGWQVWFVTCWDDAGNVNVSETRSLRVIGGPTVIAYAPKNATVGNGTNINFTYFVQDGDGIANCSLYINGALNQTNYTDTITNYANNTFFIADLSEGVYYWNITCYDMVTMSGNSVTNKLTSDRSLPSITLTGPTPGQMLLTTPVRFNFTMVDAFSPNATCNITVDGNVSAVNRNFVVSNNTPVSKPETYANGIHFWNVTCTDLGFNTNISITLNFTVNVTMPITVGVVANKDVYQIPEIASINITTKNDTNKYIPANFTLDYIYTNTTYTDVPWWSLNFPYRKPIYINETQGLARAGKPVLVNVTMPYGTLTSCVEQLRVVDDITLTEVVFTVVSGDDANYCYIAINATVSASAVNEQNYHVYYGNLSTPNPNYPNLINRTLLFDSFTRGALGATWTVSGGGWDINSNQPLTGQHAHVDGNIALGTIMPANYFNLQSYDSVNLSFSWGITNNWAVGEFLLYQFTNDSGATWTTIDTLNGGFGLLIGAANYTLNSSYKVDGFSVRFRATNNNGAKDGGFDDFNLTAYNYIQANVSSSIGKEQVWLQRITNATNSSGMILYNYTTQGRVLGNYSAVVLATSTDPKLRFGTGYDWFAIIMDTFGPNISLILPQNGMTNHTGSYNLTYNASDVANGVKNCSLYINGVFNQSNSTSINETGNNSFQMLNLPEGKYNWTVNCYDNLSNGANASNFVFYLDDTPPTILALTPNVSTLPSGTITFTFNATDNFDTQMSCNISVDNFNYSKLVNANNGSITSTFINNISDGDHVWNVTCLDNINNLGKSDTLNFTTASVPVVKLHFPPDGYGVNSTDIVLYYNLSSALVTNCSLIFNGAYNQTVNASDIPYKSNNGQNNFTFTGLNYGVYTWNVICFDSNGFNSTDTTRMFQLDNAAPSLILYSPGNGQTVYSRTVNFYFNATDVDNQLMCNLTLDGVINKTNIPANSGANTSTQVTSVTMGSHNWSVKCVDNTGFNTTSETWNFSIESIVAVSLVSPGNNTYDSDGNVTLGYKPQSTSGFNLGFCDLYVDDAYKQKKAAPTPDVTNYFNYTGLTEGNHSWYVNCTDNAAVINYSGKYYIIVDKTPPGITTYYPNGDSLTSSTVFFNWTATDNMDQSLSCNVYVNGILKTPANVASPNGSVANATYSGFGESTFNWYVVCYDDALNNVTSSNKTFTVSEPPYVSLGNPATGTRTKNQSQTFYFTATDNSGNISSCGFIFDGILNQTRTGVSSGTQSHFNVTDISNGVHNWTVNCTDPSGNMGINTSPKTFIIDLDPPNITIIAPGDGSYIPGNNVYFNWTAADYNGTNINCSLYVDNIYNKSLVQQSGTYFTPSLLNMSEETHTWYVNCSDNLGNSNVSNTSSFTINQPDLYIDNSRVAFNNTNPDENARINITANVSNIGGAPVNNALVQFWDGNPDSGGTFIGNSTGTVAFNSSKIFSIAWNITPGYHTIFILVDPLSAVAELNETNNNATKNISILKSNITSPLSGSSFVSSQLSLDFNLTDYTEGLINYSVYVDNVYNNQSGQVNDSATNNIIFNITQGVHTIKVQAEDALGRKKNSTAITVTIDSTPPSSNIVTANASWYNYSTPLISITATDNTDNMINYTIYANGAFNTAGNISNGSTIQINLATLPDNAYVLIIEAYDDLGNIANTTTPKTIYIDTTLPSIQLNAPDNGANFTTRSVLLNYTPYDNLAFTSSCNITLDGSSVNYQSGQTGLPKTYTATNLAEGIHYWNVTCKDQANNTNISETRTFNIFMAPVINLSSPANNAWVNTANNIFYFNISDETGFENCSILLNGAINQTKISSELLNNATNNITVNGMSGIYNWSMECYDNTSFKMYNVISNRTLYVDTQKPNVTIYTLNDTWFNTNPVIYFNLTDNMDSVLNYTVFVNGTANQSGTANNGQNSSVTLTTLINGTYEIIIQAMDDALNSFNGSSIIIGFDTLKPTITLLYPDNDTNLTVPTTDLNFTAYDNSGRNMICNLTLDSVVVLQNITVSNGQNINYTAYGLNGGYHFWNVTCVDIARNKNTSETRRFYVLRPDIYVNSSNILFSNNEPKENETITITALIENIGTTAAGNFTVSIWEGIPGAGGRHIGNTSINLTAGESKNVTVNYVTVLGTKQIWIFADWANIISEENETNNNASKYLSVGLWHFAMGNTQDRLVTEDATYGLLFDWEIDNSSDSNIFVIDSDSAINWNQLQALGIDTSNSSHFSDFATLDTKLNSTGFTDSVNATYTSVSAARETATYTVYNHAINNVPVYNSTDNNNFKTGILWDYGDGGTGYNGTQDVVFLTQMRNQLAGYNSTVYDYEIRIPATLRAYKGPNLNRVDFYMEIK